MLFEPEAKKIALRGIAAFNEQNPGFQLKNSDDGEKQANLSDPFGPCLDVRIDLAGWRLPQLGENIGIEQVHQEKSAGSIRSPLNVGGSNSISSMPGIDNNSTMFFLFPDSSWY